MESPPDAVTYAATPSPSMNIPLEARYSCVTCHKRKVKCDRQRPCQTCSRIKAECIYRVPAPPKRRSKPAEDGLIARLKRYEEHLKRAGISVEDPEGEKNEGEGDDSITHDPPRDQNETPKTQERGSSGFVSINAGRQAPTVPNGIKHGREGKLVVDSRSGGSRYLENNLWVWVNDELRNPTSMMQDAPEEEDNDPAAAYSLIPNASSMLFAKPGGLSFDDLIQLYPLPPHAAIMWQAFLDNVNPLCKINHIPTMRKLVQRAEQDIKSISKSDLALLYAAYAFAITSMDKAECQSKFGIPRPQLLGKYRFAIQQTLVSCSFLRSTDVKVLQAFIYYLLMMRSTFDAQTLWTLTGVATRIAQRVGLHRDGAPLGLSPFEVEMRRRLWRQLLILDHTSSEMAGSSASMSSLSNLWDTALPANVDDSDLDPEMKEPPVGKVGATEMIFCMLRYEFGNFFRPAQPPDKAFDPNFHKLTNPNTPMADRDHQINELEQKLEQNFIRYCDPLVPLHFLSAIAARSAVAGMRLRAHHPRQYNDNGASLPQEEKDMLFTLSLRIVEYDNLSHSTQATKRFLWHVRVYFQWHALIYLLGALRSRKSGEEVERAWFQLEEIFNHHPEMLSDKNYVLHKMIGSLALKAWESREGEFARLGLPAPKPAFIATLRAQVEESPPSGTGQNGNPCPFNIKHSESTPNGADSEPLSRSSDIPGPPYVTGDPSAYSDPSPIDWSQWDNLLQSLDMPEGDNIEYLFM
ncbi:hypothetical protein K402DRAFT_366189 [Aulographum hederae CBS 113979]|uniref:Zn(2)-C6 fungal-type domain-containing protein n=1 Tax=Aulographum hederae CBS 113979 TaxID=1176131 RepID=A0A6G1HGV9_9PEZI|nr:hypothetical protein K402DRAFT_366189 [Aulographum hederae CBS 113979]